MTRLTRILIFVAAIMGILVLIFSTFRLVLTYSPSASSDEPSVTDWMQGWGSLGGILVGLLAAGAAVLVYQQGQQALRASEANRREDLEQASGSA